MRDLRRTDSGGAAPAPLPKRLRLSGLSFQNQPSPRVGRAGFEAGFLRDESLRREFEGRALNTGQSQMPHRSTYIGRD